MIRCAFQLRFDHSGSSSAKSRARRISAFAADDHSARAARSITRVMRLWKR